MPGIKLNNVDLAWLRMDQENNPMMITIAVQFQGLIDHTRLLTTIEEKLRRYRRFRQKIVIPHHPFQRPYWEDAPNYRVEDHVERIELTYPSGEGALAWDRAIKDLISEKMSTALDFNRPLWQATIIENHPVGSFMIIRMHHCIADGISLMQVLLLMAQTSPDKELMRDPVETSVRTQSTATLPASHPVPSIRSSQSEANDAIPINSVPKQEEKPALSSGKNGRKPVPQTRTEPALGNHSLFEVVAAMLRIVFRRPDPKTIFKGEIGKNKRAAWSRPFDAQEIKRIAHLKQATSNDVLLAVAARAFRRYLEQHNQTGHKNIRAFVMVNLRRRFFDEELGNKFGLVFLSLPMDCQPALECLTEVKHKMDDFKASAEYMASYQLLNILGQFPEWVENLAVKILDSKGTIVATNVSGLRRQLYLAGAPIQSVMAWVPQAGRIGLGLSIVGYNNEVRIGINTDARIIPDPDVLIDLFTEEYEAFVELLPANEK